jgi:hypothetical protein
MCAIRICIPVLLLYEVHGSLGHGKDHFLAAYYRALGGEICEKLLIASEGASMGRKNKGPESIFVDDDTDDPVRHFCA